jgi:L-lactate dehydrogenase (cytochrome)
MFDGGIRTLQDALRALALGASLEAASSAAPISSAFGAGGEAGVAGAIDILHEELDVSMALGGVKSIKEVGRQILVQ